MDGSPNALLAGSGLTEAALRETDFIAWQSLAAIFDNVDAQAGAATWPVELGARLNITSHGALGFAALTAPTVGAAVATLGTYYRARITAVELILRDVDRCLELAVGDVAGDPIFTARIALIVLKVVESLLTAILGSIPDQTITVALAAPRDRCSIQIGRMYQAKLRFGADAYSIAIPASWKNLPSPLHENSVYRNNILECQHLIERSNAFSTTTGMVSYLLQAWLDASMAGHAAHASPPSLETIAERMAVTPRTLIRRLKQEAGSYQGVLDGLRQAYAERMLADAAFSIAEIATHLGYTEPPNFGRAFRRWYGVSPVAWRRALRGPTQ
ncbi:MAG: AraC family transcriptional regulator [Salinisphaera sp.]|nr:AraC family transcriptional regulator [Salinisphaera sp.]